MGNQLRILVVDDERFHADALCDFLAQEGHQCAAVSGGAEAIEHVNRDAPDVVITDFNMPGMNGIELLQLLRGSHPGTRVILLTGFADTDNAIDAVNFGATAFFRKPLNLRCLLATLQGIAREVAKERKQRARIVSLQQDNAHLRDTVTELRKQLATGRPRE